MLIILLPALILYRSYASCHGHSHFILLRLLVVCFILKTLHSLNNIHCGSTSFMNGHCLMSEVIHCLKPFYFQVPRWGIRRCSMRSELLLVLQLSLSLRTMFREINLITAPQAVAPAPCPCEQRDVYWCNMVWLPGVNGEMRKPIGRSCVAASIVA